MHIEVKEKCVQLLLLSLGFSQFAAVLLQQLETKLAKDFKEIHVGVLLQSLLLKLKSKTYAIPGHTGKAQAQFNRGYYSPII